VQLVTTIDRHCAFRRYLVGSMKAYSECPFGVPSTLNGYSECPLGVPGTLRRTLSACTVGSRILNIRQFRSSRVKLGMRCRYRVRNSKFTSMIILLAIHTFGCFHVLRLARSATVRSGVTAAVAGLIANAFSLFRFGVRPLLALPVLVAACVAVAGAFKLADDLPRDTDEERHASQTGMALVALAIAESLIMLVAAFLWMTS
jgi:hypothetical protein